VDVFDGSLNLVSTPGAFTDPDLPSGFAPFGIPWGIAQAPAGFGRFTGDLLLGNFGDGEITASGRDEDGSWGPRGQLGGADHQRIVVDGLWALEVGHGAPKQRPGEHAVLHRRPQRRGGRAVRLDHSRMTTRRPGFGPGRHSPRPTARWPRTRRPSVT
jgi:hypothetical protein